MANVFLSSEQQGIVVFWLWKTLEYWKRMLIGFGCIGFGFMVQYFFWESFWWGLPFLLAGNLFLLVRGYDNRVNFGKYAPASGWEEVEPEKIEEIEALTTKMRKWDRSVLDSSNKLGGFIFLLIFVSIAICYVCTSASGNMIFALFATDAAILLIPLWVTGKRDIMNKPKLQIKIKLIKRLLSHRKVEALIAPLKIDYFLLLKGKEGNQVPENIKIRVNFPQQHPDFLGFYGQIVTNKVGNKTYPYFYVVLVAKKGYGLQRAYASYRPSSRIVKEFKKEGDVEVFVIRQKTTKTSGYHTNPRKIRRIFLEGLHVAEEAATS